MERTGLTAIKKQCVLLSADPMRSFYYKLTWLYKGEKVGALLEEGNEQVLYISPELDYPMELITVRLLEFALKEHLDVDSILLALEETDEESIIS